jgi:prevent-host-death family protein
VIAKIISASDLRERMEEILTAAAEESEPQYITYRSRPTAVLLGYEYYQALMEQLEDLSDTVAIYERQGEPRISFEEYRARQEQTEHVPPLSAPPG